MESLINFVLDYWLLVAVVVLVGLLIIYLFKSLISILILLAFGAGIMIYGFNYTPEQVTQIGKEALTTVKDVASKTIVPILEKELKDAKVTFNKDESYVMETNSLKITGVKGSSVAKVSFLGKEYEMDVKLLGDNFAKTLEEAKNNTNIK